jgi:glycosyltransferase involved in cell wall biosynthesis
MRRVLFFVRTKDPTVLDLVAFYRDDLRALRELGLQVEIVTRLRDLPRHRSIDLVYAWWFGFGFFAVLWAHLLGRPSILTGTAHALNGGTIDDWPWHKRLLIKAALRLATQTLFISRTELSRLGTARPRAARVAYCSVDLDAHIPAAVPAGKFIVSISHLTTENVSRKKVLECIDAFGRFHRSHPDYRYVLVGVHGSAIQAVRRHIAELELSDAVELPGRVSHKQKLEFLQAATAYLQPSRCEGFGLALLEAAACGCPVVTNREPCIVEINGNAVLYGETEEELAVALTELANNFSLREEMRARGLANARRFSYENRREALRSAIEAVGVLPPRLPLTTPSSPRRTG